MRRNIPPDTPKPGLQYWTEWHFHGNHWRIEIWLPTEVRFFKNRKRTYEPPAHAVRNAEKINEYLRNRRSWDVVLGWHNRY